MSNSNVYLGKHAISREDGDKLKLSLKDSSVTTSKIADGAITYDKFSDAVKDIIELASSGGALLDGSVSTSKIADDAVTTDKIADYAIQTSNIADSNVTLSKLADDAKAAYAVTVTKEETPTTGSQASYTVAQGGTVLSTKIEIPEALEVDNSTLENINNTISIKDGGVVTDKLSDGSVTEEKLDNILQERLGSIDVVYAEDSRSIAMTPIVSTANYMSTSLINIAKKDKVTLAIGDSLCSSSGNTTIFTASKDNDTYIATSDISCYLVSPNNADTASYTYYANTTTFKINDGQITKAKLANDAKVSSLSVTEETNDIKLEIKDGDNTVITSDTIDKASTSSLGVVKVDSSLSSTSENPVQNKAIYTETNGLKTRVTNVENKANIIAPDYSATSTYAVGDIVVHNGSRYKCTTAITTAESWNANHWTHITDNISVEAANTASKVTSVIAKANTVVEDFSSSSIYSVGAIVYYNGSRYKCTTAVTSAGAWNATNWTIITDSVSKEVSTISVNIGSLSALTTTNTDNLVSAINEASKSGEINSVNISVDSNVGTPSATASISNKTLNLAFNNLKGESGNSFTVNGMYDTYDALIAVHPSGTEGDAYMVGTTESNVVYNWDVDKNAWDNIGPIRGEAGAAATIEVGSVTSGTIASVTNVGTLTAAKFDFVLPKGDDGVTPTISVSEKSEGKTTITITDVSGTKTAEILDGTGSGTVTSVAIKMNGNVIDTITDSGTIDLGTVNTDISEKQDKLGESQLSAVNSGITSTKVGTYDGYATTIAANTTNIEANASNISSLSTTVSGHTVSINTLGESVAELTTKVSANESSISSLKSKVDPILTGSTTTENITSIPVTNKLVVATISSIGENDEFKLNYDTIPSAGTEIHTIIKNSSAEDVITIPLCDDSPYIVCGETSIEIAAGDYGEVNAISDGTHIYLRGI